MKNLKNHINLLVKIIDHQLEVLANKNLISVMILLLNIQLIEIKDPYVDQKQMIKFQLLVINKLKKKLKIFKLIFSVKCETLKVVKKIH